ncbi:ATPase [Bacteroidia bacterium]|nr:ATPase [Bacteroidia bacterium]
MDNPFKFGSVVDNEYFTDRINEQQEVRQVLDSPNHLILISPRRFGKTSLIEKVTAEMDRPVISLDLQLVTGITDFAAQLLKRVLKINKLEKFKQLIAAFRIVPTIELNPLTSNLEISFQPSVKESFTTLEDVFNLIEKIGEKGKRPIVILDEFQEIVSLNKNLSKQLRSVIQHHQNVNYVFLGSLESMMKAIFETKKSPFYHFGYLMRLEKIPYSDFYEYLTKRLMTITAENERLSSEILRFTDCHPFYTQQLAYYCWAFLEKNEYESEMFHKGITNIIRIHDTDYERLWNTISKTDKKVLIALASNENFDKLQLATSTIYSGIKRLIAKGYLIKDNTFKFDDPFFKHWIENKRNINLTHWL